jgi:RNA polymerase sigma factor (sigma-70 family)
LIRSIIHKCGEFHRKTKTRLEVIGPWLDNVSEREGDPVFAFIQQEQVRDVQNAITHLPKHLREVVMLRFYAQYSEKEIAANLGVSVRTVRNRFHKVQEQLRILLSLETFHGPTVRTKIRKRLV